MRYSILLLISLALWPTGGRAQNFDYYVFTLSWAPEFCHENPSNHTAECSAQASQGFVVHGLWPDNNDRSDPTQCAATAFDPAAVPASLKSIMPANLYQHEWEKHGVCSGMNESDYFNKIAAVYHRLVIPVSNTGQDQHVAPSALRTQFSKANPGWMPSAFSIQDKSNSLVAVRVCMTKSFGAMSCPAHGDTRNTAILIRARP